jgi:hypothetical protein
LQAEPQLASAVTTLLARLVEPRDQGG